MDSYEFLKAEKDRITAPSRDEQEMAREIAEIQKRVDAATPEPWEWVGPTEAEKYRGEYRTYVHRQVGCGDVPPEKFYISIQSVGDKERDDADAAFIAHARQDIPRLLDLYHQQIAQIISERQNIHNYRVRVDSEHEQQIARLIKERDEAAAALAESRTVALEEAAGIAESYEDSIGNAACNIKQAIRGRIATSEEK